mgnify:CR=1 FL=1
MLRRPPRSTQSRSSAASDVYKRQIRKVVTERRNHALGRDEQLGPSRPLGHKHIDLLHVGAPEHPRIGGCDLFRTKNSCFRLRSLGGREFSKVERKFTRQHMGWSGTRPDLVGIKTGTAQLAGRPNIDCFRQSTGLRGTPSCNRNGDEVSESVVIRLETADPVDRPWVCVRSTRENTFEQLEQLTHGRHGAMTSRSSVPGRERREARRLWWPQLSLSCDPV